jgi:hypothetical protein
MEIFKMDLSSLTKEQKTILSVTLKKLSMGDTNAAAKHWALLIKSLIKVNPKIQLKNIKALTKQVQEKLNLSLKNQGDLTHLAPLALQTSQEETARIVQILSNILKTWHDEAQNIIDNLRG